MSSEKQTKLPPIEEGYRINPALPIIPLERHVQSAYCSQPHAHPRGQLIYASRGVMRVVTENNIWFVPPWQAVWVPPQVVHQVFFPGEVSINNLFIDPSALGELPRECCVWQVSALLRELIRKAMRIGDTYPQQGPESRLVGVILDELRVAKLTPLQLPLGQDERLKRVMEHLIAHPDEQQTMESLSERACCSARTLARLFLAETGMSFGQWRRQLRLMEAMDRLFKGDSVTCVAFELGYRSVSAFGVMFRKTLGKSPTEFLIN